MLAPLTGRSWYSGLMASASGSSSPSLAWLLRAIDRITEFAPWPSLLVAHFTCRLVTIWFFVNQRVYNGKYFGKDVIIKERFTKKYRHPVLDQKITTKRVAQEAKQLAKCKLQFTAQSAVAPLFDVPAVYFVDATYYYRIFMEQVHGCTVKQYLLDQFAHFEKQYKEERRLQRHNHAVDKMISVGASDSDTIVHDDDDELVLGDGAPVNCYDDGALKLAYRIGQTVATLHDNTVIHGDLTTSNMILRDNDPEQLVMIDFGLSYTSTMEEDKGVDLYVLERALISTHPLSQKLVRAHFYLFTCRKACKVLTSTND